MKMTVTRTAFIASFLLFTVALLSGCGWPDRYNVQFGLRADMSDKAPDPQSVTMLDTSASGKRPIRRPAQEVLTTEGMDEALDDDMDQISPEAAATIQEKQKATSDLLAPPQK